MLGEANRLMQNWRGTYKDKTRLTLANTAIDNLQRWPCCLDQRNPICTLRPGTASAVQPV